MPIPVVCNSCGTKLVAPDAAAGKKVKCKNCQSVIAVPVPVAKEESDFEFVDPASLAPPKPVAAKPVVAVAVPAKPKSPPAVVYEDENNGDFDFGSAPKKSKAKVVADDDEDDAPKPKKKSKAVVALDDDDEDDAPRKSKKKKAVVEDDDGDDEDEAPRKGKKGKPGKKAAKKRVNPLILVLGGVGALFALAFIGVMIWYVAVREKDGGTASPTKQTAADGLGGPFQPQAGFVVPAGWTKHEKPAFAVHMQDSLGKPGANGPDTGDAATLSVEKKGPKGTFGLEVSAIKVPPDTFAALVANPQGAYSKMEQQLQRSGKITILGRSAASVDGQTGNELKLQNNEGVGYARIVLANGRIYTFGVQAPTWPEADELAKIFFGSAKLKG